MVLGNQLYGAQLYGSFDFLSKDYQSPQIKFFRICYQLPKFVSHILLVHELGLQHPGCEATLLSANYFFKLQDHANPLLCAAFHSIFALNYKNNPIKSTLKCLQEFSGATNFDCLNSRLNFKLLLARAREYSKSRMIENHNLAYGVLC